MSILLKTNDANALRLAYEKDMAAGIVATWKKDVAGDYIHDTPQWRSAGWFTPHELPEGLRLTLYIGSESKKFSFYAEAHGAMVYSMIYHCCSKFDGIEVTEWPSHGASSIIT